MNYRVVTAIAAAQRSLSHPRRRLHREYTSSHIHLRLILPGTPRHANSSRVCTSCVRVIATVYTRMGTAIADIDYRRNLEGKNKRETYLQVQNIPIRFVPSV